MSETSFYDLTFPQLQDLLKTQGLNAYQATPLFKNYYKNTRPKELSERALNFAKSQFSPFAPRALKTQKSGDGTVKFLLEVRRGHSIETVLIPFHKKYTVCLSSQVGCAMGCEFCYTAKQGFTRHLSAGEIVTQYVYAYQWLKENIDPDAVKPNIVYMGQGEPLHNFDEIRKATEIFLRPEGLHLGPRQITLSTIGPPRGLRRLDELPPINLALSLHSPFEKERNRLIPMGRSFPLDELLETLDAVPLKKRQFITFEYLIVKNLNHTPEHAEALAERLKDRRAIVNLIPFNPFPEIPPWLAKEKPAKEEVDEFKNKLVERGLRVMVRTTKGDEILAACGQLNSQGSLKGRKTP